MPTTVPIGSDVFACPICKQPLIESSCRTCTRTYPMIGPIRNLFSCSNVAVKYQKIGEFYDQLYGSTENTWKELAGRGDCFNTFIAGLLSRSNPTRVLDIGCGQGQLLTAIPNVERYGIDISSRGLVSTIENSQATVCAGIAEELPFRNGVFDAVVGIGVVTHFLDPIGATKEIHRVLTERGVYVAGVFVRLTPLQRTLDKFSDYFITRWRPFGFVSWAWEATTVRFRRRGQKSRNDRHQQPVERLYTTKELRSLFIAGGFAVTDTITKRSVPTAPLSGHHFYVFVLQKAGLSGTTM